jgi:hypothetical protein
LVTIGDVSVRRVLAFALPEDEVTRTPEERIVAEKAPGRPFHFKRVLQAAMGDSMIFVLDVENNEVFAFSFGDGRWLGAVPRVTAGSRIDQIAPLPGGRVLGWDRRREEFWIMGFENTAQGPMGVKLAGRPRDDILVSDTSVWLWSTIQGGHPTGSRNRVAREYTLQGDRLGGIHLPPVVWHEPAFFLFSPGGLRLNFSRARLVQWSPDHGLLHGENSEYGFFIERGDTSFSVVVAYDRAAIGDLEERWWEAKADEFNALEGKPTYSVPKTKPAYRAISWEDGGRIWVERYVQGVRIDSISTGVSATAMPVTEPVILDVFDRVGTYLWTVRLPPRSRVLDTEGNSLLMATQVDPPEKGETVRVMTIGKQ